MGASKNIVWGMAAYNLRGMEDGNFSRFKCRIAMENEAISLSQHPVTIQSLVPKFEPTIE